MLDALKDPGAAAGKRQLKSGWVEYATLDFPTLTDHWSLKLGTVRHELLIYPPDLIPGLEAVWVIVDVRDVASGRAVLRQEYSDERGDIDQFIRLSRSNLASPLRWFFVCPLTGLRGELLVLREGLFASREAQRLRYRSQGARALKRTATKELQYAPRVACIVPSAVR